VVRVTLGVPVYNAEGTVAETVESLLRQTYQDFELIVSDNASTDRTVAIVQSIAERDSRVRVIRQGWNIGANGNYSALVAAARGEYFKWSSASDWCAPTFIERCVAFLEARPDVALAFPGTRTFGASRADAEDYPNDVDFSDEDPVRRLIRVIECMRLNNAVNGVFRTAVLRRTKIIEHFPGADVVLMANVALLGKMCLLPEKLYYRRMTPDHATSLQGAEAVRAHHYPNRTARSLLPHWRWYLSQVRAVFTAGLSASDLGRALFYTLRMMHRDFGKLTNDVVIALKYPFCRST
jgi:glycosyltransferase involved in cell wall biosynthesis